MMVSLAGLEPATICLEDSCSDSAELQALETGPKSRVQKSKVRSTRTTFDFGLLGLS